jgi:hypothetical protein
MLQAASTSRRPAWRSLGVLESELLSAASAAHYPRLRTLCLLGCRAELHWLQSLLAKNTAQELLLSGDQSGSTTLKSLTQTVPFLRQTHRYDVDVAAEMSCFVR